MHASVGPGIAPSRALADVGEVTLSLRLLEARRKPAPDPAAAVEREDLRASLLYRARRYEAAASAYRGLVARPRRPALRADPALGLARSLRSQHLFQPADSVFMLAAAWDTVGTVREAAAWERAREWEDQKPPRGKRPPRVKSVPIA